ncbi:MAG TPA: hypothetical protein PLB96_08170 [Syntrophales bacterium]|nr:hypothetical protein [Syntrophales bacterium]
MSSHHAFFICAGWFASANVPQRGIPSCLRWASAATSSTAWRGTSPDTVFRGGLYYIPAYLLSIAVLMASPYWMVLVLANLVR